MGQHEQSSSDRQSISTASSTDAGRSRPPTEAVGQQGNTRSDNQQSAGDRSSLPSFSNGRPSVAIGGRSSDDQSTTSNATNRETSQQSASDQSQHQSGNGRPSVAIGGRSYGDQSATSNATNRETSQQPAGDRSQPQSSNGRPIGAGDNSGAGHPPASLTIHPDANEDGASATARATGNERVGGTHIHPYVEVTAGNNNGRPSAGGAVGVDAGGRHWNAGGSLQASPSGQSAEGYVSVPIHGVTVRADGTINSDGTSNLGLNIAFGTDHSGDPTQTSDNTLARIEQQLDQAIREGSLTADQIAARWRSMEFRPEALEPRSLPMLGSPSIEEIAVRTHGDNQGTVPRLPEGTTLGDFHLRGVPSDNRSPSLGGDFHFKLNNAEQSQHDQSGSRSPRENQ